MYLRNALSVQAGRTTDHTPRNVPAMLQAFLRTSSRAREFKFFMSLQAMRSFPYTPLPSRDFGVSMTGATPVWHPPFHRNFGRLGLGGIDADFCKTYSFYLILQDLQNLNTFVTLHK